MLLKNLVGLAVTLIGLSCSALAADRVGYVIVKDQVRELDSRSLMQTLIANLGGKDAAEKLGLFEYKTGFYQVPVITNETICEHAKYAVSHVGQSELDDMNTIGLTLAPAISEASTAMSMQAGGLELLSPHRMHVQYLDIMPYLMRGQLNIEGLCR